MTDRRSEQAVVKDMGGGGYAARAQQECIHAQKREHESTCVYTHSLTVFNIIYTIYILL